MVATRYLFEKTFDAFRNGTPPPASAQDGRDVLEVISACYQAAASGQRIALAEGNQPEHASLLMGAAIP
jgi:predicted dehydrogenase